MEYLERVHSAWKALQDARHEAGHARDELDQALRLAYEAGATMMTLADCIGVSYKLVRTALIRSGANLRPAGVSRKATEGGKSNEDSN